MEFGEAVDFKPDIHQPEKCPFCPLEKKKDDGKKAVIGEGNSSSTLGSNLENAGDKKAKHLYYDYEYGLESRYSAEAHHLICGNEVLKEEQEVEKYLVKETRKNSKGAAGYLKPNDVDYDVNAARNGIWLPSVPDVFRQMGKKQPERWWGDQSAWNKKHPSKPPRVSVEAWEKTTVAFIVMEEVKRQFHKGEHGAVGTPDDNYVKMAIGRLKQVTVFVEHFSDVCPMGRAGKPKTKPPYYPPHRLIGILNLLSDSLKKELVGHPVQWKFYISEFARECSLHWKSLTP